MVNIGKFQKKNDNNSLKDYVFMSRYSKPVGSSKETYSDAVNRVMQMHMDYLEPKVSEENKDKFNSLFLKAYEAYHNQDMIGAQRSLQFGGEGLLKHHARLLNCTGTFCDRLEVFSHIMYLSLCGCGVGYHIHPIHTDKLPKVKGVDKSKKELYIIGDSIEGWADAVDKVIQSHFNNKPKVEFDFSKIRPKGAPISGGFLAPGSAPLEKCLDILNDILSKSSGRKLRPFECHLLICTIADAVVSGGVRRSALICLFDIDDEEMMNCKTGNWFINYPQLARANNSAVLLPDTSKDKYERVFQSAKEYGEPGFAFMPNLYQSTNPCFSGDSKLLTTEGYKTFKELDGKDFSIINAYGKVSESRVWKSGNKDTIMLYGSKGVNPVAICTPDHLFMTVDGKELEAKDLKGEKIKVPDFPENDFYDESKKKSGLYISSIKKGDKIDVYDFEDPEDHWGIVNGLQAHNCFEIGMFPTLEPNNPKKTSFSVCNLVDINGGRVKTEEDFYKFCESAAILCTFQTAYTDFPYVGKVMEEIVRRDALVGVGITGMASNPDVLFNQDVLAKGAEIVKKTNKEVASIIGINPAARTCCIKPSGNASQMLATSSGIHPFHSKRYIRNVQGNAQEQSVKIFESENPLAVEKSIYGTDDKILSFRVEYSDNVLQKEDLTAVDFMNIVKDVQSGWIKGGTNHEHPVYSEYKEMKGIEHNVSNTITVLDNEWETVKTFLWDNKDSFCGVSFLRGGGDLDYKQSPYIKVLDEVELAEEYGSAAILAGGFIVDGIRVFGDLYDACDIAISELTGNPKMYSRDISVTKESISEILKNNLDDKLQFMYDHEGVILTDVNAVSSALRKKEQEQRSWIDRFDRFSKKYLSGDYEKTSECLKRVSMYHRWQQLNQSKEIDWASYEWNNAGIDADTIAGQACFGGKCEV